MTQVFGIVGDPIAQVRSPEVFNGLFRERGIDAVMVPMQVAASGLTAALAGLRAVGNVAGLVVTVPHKIAAAALLQVGSERVHVAGAANALRPCAGGWEGDLFDGEGFVLGLAAKWFDLSGKTCAIVGAGGAGAAIALALADRPIRSISVWDLDGAKATALVRRLAGVSRVPLLVGKPDGDTDLAINATPLGMSEDDPMPIALDRLRTTTMVADVIMKPPVTRLLSEAQHRGHATQEGRHMLDSQVDAIWRFFGLP